MWLLKKTVVMMAAIIVTSTVGSGASFARSSTSSSHRSSDQQMQQKVTALISKMTLQEKISMVHGVRKHGYIGYIPGIDRLNIPALKLTDGPAGVRQAGTTAFPAPISLAAAWDTGLARRYGAAVGEETRAKDQNQILGPTINILRTPQWGRSFESFSEDPYLTSQLAVSWIKGAQRQGVIATAKHYIANNQEYNRKTVSSNVSKRALHEIYFPAFKAAVQQAHVGSIMASYNKVNGTYASENVYILKKTLDHDWGFKGFVVTDWRAAHSTIAAANHGLDLEMPVGTYFGKPLLKAVKNGKVSKARLNNMVERILTSMYQAGLFDKTRPQGNLNHNKLTQAVAEQGTVLLKNTNDVLPLNKNQLHSLAVIGRYARNPKVSGGGSAHIDTTSSISPLKGIKKMLGDNVDVRYAQGVSLDTRSSARKKEIDKAADVAKQSDIAVVVVADNRTEGSDRDNLELPFNQSRLIKAVEKANPNTIVVLNTGGPVLMDKWINGAKGIVEAWYAGQKGGSALADVLFGKVNPSGKLPITFQMKAGDASTGNTYPGNGRVARYTDGIYVGYRWFDKKGVKPQFAFGYGLSYTTFKYKNLQMPSRQDDAQGTVPVSLDVTNTGNRQGATVVQLYVHDRKADAPINVKQLRAFKKVTLQPRETKHVIFKLERHDFAHYTTSRDGWVVDPGMFDIEIGKSSRNIVLKHGLELEKGSFSRDR